MTKNEFAELHSILKRALDTNLRLKHFCYYVGDCTRDVILNRPINNIEIVVMQPHGGIDLANHITKFYKCHEKGVNPLISEIHGMASFTLEKEFPKLKGVTISCSMTKRPSMGSDNGLKKVFEYGGIRTDAEMRDLTINAIYANLQTCQYLDVLGNGLNDIAEHKLHTCIDPNIAFRESPLKIMKTIRFASELGWGIPKTVWMNICRHADKVGKVDPLLIQGEFDKILVSDFADEGIRKLCNSDVMQAVIPDFELLKKIPHGKDCMETVFDHSLNVMMKTEPITAHRLSGLLHDVGKVFSYGQNVFGKTHFHDHEKKGAEIAKEILGIMGYSELMIEKVTKAVEMHGKFKNAVIPSKHAIRRFIKDVGSEDLHLCFDVINADNNSQGINKTRHNQVENIVKRMERLKEEEDKSKIHIPINGKDIMEKFGIRKGPIIGKALDVLKEHAAISPKMSKEEAYEIVEEVVKQNSY